MSKNKFYENAKVKKLKGSEVEITAEIPVDAITHHRENILEEMRKDFTAPGFRKGNVPMNIFMKHVNEIPVLEEATQLALNDAYPEIVKDEDLKVFGRPRIIITKLAPQNPVEFKIHVGTIPEFKLPDYKKIAKKIVDEKEEEILVSEEDVNSVLKQIKSMRKTKDDGSKAENEADTELTDEYVKTLGNFVSVQDLKDKVKENLKREKEGALWQKKRESILDTLIEQTKMDLPNIVIEDEADAIRDRFNANLAEKNLNKEEYLKKINKTEEEIRKEDVSHIQKELKVRLILDKIAEAEKIDVSEGEIEAEMEFMTQRHPEADQNHLRNYIESILRNEKLLRFLEGRAEAKTHSDHGSHDGHNH